MWSITWLSAMAGIAVGSGAAVASEAAGAAVAGAGAPVSAGGAAGSLHAQTAAMVSSSARAITRRGKWVMRKTAIRSSPVVLIW